MVRVVAGTHQKLLLGTLAAAVGTAAFYATGVDWSWAHERGEVGPAVLAYLMAVSFGLFPYALLVALLRRTKSSTIFQVASFTLFLALPIAAFSWWRLSGVKTAGWDFLIVPVLQAALIAVLYGLSRLVVPCGSNRPSVARQ